MTFVCTSCQREFVVAAATLAKFPNWTPKTCMSCKKGKWQYRGVSIFLIMEVLHLIPQLIHSCNGHILMAFCVR